MAHVLDANGWPVEHNPGPWTKTGYNSDGTRSQYTHGQTGAPIPNPYPFLPQPGDGGGRQRGIADLLAPRGTWTSRTVSSHPFQGLQGLLESSILGRLMSQAGQASPSWLNAGQQNGEIRGLRGGGIAWNHLEDPFGRLDATTRTYRPAVVMPPRIPRVAEQLENPFNDGPLGGLPRQRHEGGRPRPA